jgi:hypothetical protein
MMFSVHSKGVEGLELSVLIDHHERRCGKHSQDAIIPFTVHVFGAIHAD